MHIVVELDGVLRDTKHGIIPTGLLMYSTLTAYNRMTILSEEDEAATMYWLNSNKVVDVDNVIDNTIALEDEELVPRQINMARARGNIDLFITSNPAHWVYAFNLGISSVMFAMPAYLRPEFRPDAPRNRRSWDEIQKAIDKQNEARVKDIRLTRTDDLNFE